MDYAFAHVDRSARSVCCCVSVDRRGQVRWDARCVVLARAMLDGQACKESAQRVQATETDVYKFHLVANDPAKLTVNGQSVRESLALKPRVCGP